MKILIAPVGFAICDSDNNKYRIIIIFDIFDIITFRKT